MKKLNIISPNKNNKVINITSEDDFKKFLSKAEDNHQAVLGLYKFSSTASYFLIRLNNNEYEVAYLSDYNKTNSLPDSFRDYNYIVIDKCDFD